MDYVANGRHGELLGRTIESMGVHNGSVTRMMSASLERVWGIYTDLSITEDVFSNVSALDSATHEGMEKGAAWQETRTLFKSEVEGRARVVACVPLSQVDIAFESPLATFTLGVMFHDNGMETQVDITFTSEVDADKLNKSTRLLVPRGVALRGLRQHFARDLADLAQAAEYGLPVSATSRMETRRVIDDDLSFPASGPSASPSTGMFSAVPPAASTPKRTTMSFGFAADPPSETAFGSATASSSALPPATALASPETTKVPSQVGTETETPAEIPQQGNIVPKADTKGAKKSSAKTETDVPSQTSKSPAKKSLFRKKKAAKDTTKDAAPEAALPPAAVPTQESAKESAQDETADAKAAPTTSNTAQDEAPSKQADADAPFGSAPAAQPAVAPKQEKKTPASATTTADASKTIDEEAPKKTQDTAKAAPAEDSKEQAFPGAADAFPSTSPQQAHNVNPFLKD